MALSPAKLRNPHAMPNAKPAGPQTGQGNFTSITSTGPGVVGRTLFGVNKLTSPVYMLSFIPSSVPEALSKGLAWMGKLPVAGAPFRFAARAVVVPTAILGSEQPLHEMGTAAAAKLGLNAAPVADKARKWFGSGVVDRIGNTPVNRSVMNGAHYSMQAVTGYQAFSVISEGNRVMRHMFESITGQKTGMFFPLQILFGRLPESMREVRRQYMENIGPRTLLSAVIIGASEMFNRSNASGLAKVMGMGLQLGAVGVQTGSVFFATQNNLFNAYPALAMAQEHGETITRGGYFALLKHALPQNSQYSDYALAEVAKQYEAETIPVGKVMQEMDNGKLYARLRDVKPPVVVAPAEPPLEPAKPVTIGGQTFAPKASAIPAPKEDRNWVMGVKSGDRVNAETSHPIP